MGQESGFDLPALELLTRLQSGIRQESYLKVQLMKDLLLTHSKLGDCWQNSVPHWLLARDLSQFPDNSTSLNYSLQVKKTMERIC